MARKPTYEELEKMVTALEQKAAVHRQAEAKIKDLNAELISNEARHRSLLKSMPDPVVVYDMDGRVNYVNPAFSQTFGWALEELRGKRIEFVPEENWPETRVAIDRMMGGENVLLFETRRSTKDDRILDIQLSTSLFHDPEGHPRGNIVILRDVTNQKRAEEALQKAHNELERRVETRTQELLAANEQLKQEVEERKRTEAALKESEENYRYIVEHAPTGIYEIDFINRRFTSVNDAICEFSGYTREELLSIDPGDILTEESRDRFVERTLKAFAGEKVPDSVEFQIRTKTGKENWVLLNTRYKYEEGKLIGASVIAQDISEIKRTEEALRISEEKYRLLVENANDAIFIAQDESIKFPNPKTFQLTGYSLEEVKDTPFINLIHPDDRNMILERHRQRLKGETLPDTYSFRIIRKTGEELWVQLNTVIISWEGRPATLNFLRDVTQQRRLEFQLQQAKKMESLGTLAGGIAHDFNNLLMGVQGRTSLMLIDAGASHRYFDHLKGIEEYVKSAADLTKQLLGFARGGKYEVKPIDLNALIKNQNRMFGRTKKEIMIRGKYEANLWAAEVDAGQMEQVLLNIYVNAWQSMPGGGDLYVQTENVTIDESHSKAHQVEPGKYIRISVTDTGVGMDADIQQRIFDPFFTTRAMGRGTGLGLASTYGIIKNHGGFLEVYSEKGKGATFEIYLPATEKSVVADGQIREELLRGEETILLVDDEDLIVEVGKKLLAELGYTPLTAGNGAAAIKIYKKNRDRIALVILDMIMPEMDGGETYDRLKQINPHIKVLLSSGYSINGKAGEILERGCDGFIQKPFKISDMSKKMRAILDYERKIDKNDGS
ncbi:MAG: PAS domain S-box protein [Deltaproteobacteria bacterium]|nr:PAS domain S-box protein [Deltaproteobacteria bacterium]